MNIINILRKKCIPLFLASAVFFSSAGAVCAADDSGSVNVVPGPVSGDAENAVKHAKYISGYADGTVRPGKMLTRAEAVQILYNLGLVSEPPAESFKTSPLIPRGDFGNMIIAAKSELSLSDIFTGYPDGSLGLEKNLTRAEAVTVINRALGRKADEFSINVSQDIRVLPDVKKGNWAYYDLLEAMTEHTCVYQDSEERWESHEPGKVDLAAGWHNINGELFHVNENGLFDYKTTVDGIKLDDNGRYTTDDYRLDPLLTAEIQKIITPEMTQMQKLRSVYDYMMNNYGYRASTVIEEGATGWEADMAVEMLQSGKGNCYSWAATFTYLARKCGYDAKAIAGKGISPKGSERDHAWTEITIDGVPYTFDPEIEAVYAKTNGETYSLFMKKYDEAAWKYIKPANEPQEPVNPGDQDQPEPDAKLCGIIEKIYKGTPLEESSVYQAALTSELEMNAFGVNGIDYKVGVISEPMITSVAHSIVLVEMNEGADIEAAKQTIKTHADPNKWICVGVAEEDVLVDNYENYIVLIMDNESDILMENFHKAMKELS